MEAVSSSSMLKDAHGGHCLAYYYYSYYYYALLHYPLVPLVAILRW